MAPRFLPKSWLSALLIVLQARGYRVLGPIARDGGVLFDDVQRVADLPLGLRDEQEAGRYRLDARRATARSSAS